MADLHKHSVREALNTDVSGGWDVENRIDISSQAHGSHTLSEGTRHLMIWSDSQCYFRFDKSATDTIDTNNDVKFPAETLFEIRVPKGLEVQKDDNIVFHCKQVSSAATSYVRIVEV